MKNIILAAIALLTMLSPVLIKRLEAQFRASEAFMKEAVTKNLQENSPAKMVRKQYWDCTAKFGRSHSYMLGEGLILYQYDHFSFKRSLSCSLAYDQWQTFKTAAEDFFFYF